MLDLIWAILIQILIWCLVWLFIRAIHYLSPKNEVSTIRCIVGSLMVVFAPVVFVYSIWFFKGQPSSGLLGLKTSIGFGLGIQFILWFVLINKFGSTKLSKNILGWFVCMILMVLMIACSRSFFMIWTMPSTSMENTIQKGDFCVSNEAYYGWSLFGKTKRYFEFHKPRRGDVLVFRDPLNQESTYVKRCVGIPGDTISIRGKMLIVNGRRMVESYSKFTDPEDLPKGEAINDEKDVYGPVTLGEGKIFVLSDNRNSGLDSRNWGPIDERSILGKISAIYWRGREKRILLKEVH